MINRIGIGIPNSQRSPAFAMSMPPVCLDNADPSAEFRANRGWQVRPRANQAMNTPKFYKCWICGAEILDLPMPVLKHQMSHVTRRPFARHESGSPDPRSRDLEPNN
jgi:hypothetical protein